VSPVGAQGLGQFMPGTWRDVVRDLQWDSAVSAFNPERAIRAAARYQGQQRRMWHAAGRTSGQRNDLGLCNYNAGARNCLEAQRRCLGARLWPEISPCLHMVTGRHAVETITYVDRINRFATTMSVRP
jgi:membrane-bound lytic murein transglycosylase F